jgi:aldose 1-epimerase
MSHVTLKAGNSIATLAPDVGGGISGLILAGHEILLRERSVDADDADPRNLGEFPMAPWVNRIANGRFAWQGREICVVDGPGHDPQGLHGIGWRSSWSVSDRSETEVTLGITWDGGSGTGWPFPFKFTRRFIIQPHGFAIEARLTNLGTQPMPSAIGFHPYFPTRGAFVRAQASDGWVTDRVGLPSHLGLEDVAVHMRSGLIIADEPLDNCFVGWDGVVVIDWPTHTLTMRTQPALPYLQIYSPVDGDRFCVEPQSAIPDAFNRDPATSGVCILAPGANLSACLHLHVTPAVKTERL